MDIFKSDKRLNFICFVGVVLLFGVFSIWFFYIHTLDQNFNLDVRQLWGSLYQIFALGGGIFGIFVSRKWGGYKSLLGKAILLISFGLLFQSFGQSVSSFYNYVEKNNLPYPSMGDIGFFGSTICYIFAGWFIAKGVGLSSSLKSIKGKIAFLIPLSLFILIYFLFLQNYQFDWTQPLKIFLDFGYPVGDILYVSIALFAFLLSGNFLGGILKKPIMFIVVALILQYVSDFTFLYQSNAGVWSVGGINDYMYAASYFVMTLAVINIGNTFYKLKSENSSTKTNSVTDSSDTLKVLNQILSEIISRQEKVMGELAWQEVKKISEINIVDKASFTVTVSGNPKDAIDKLVYGFKNLFGDIALEVSKNAVKYLTAELPIEDIPDSLR